MTQASIRAVAGTVTDFDDLEGILSGYVFIWGDADHRDAYDTWFDRSRPPELAIDHGVAGRPISYEHALDGVVRHEVIGWLDRVWYDDRGLRYEGHLDRSGPFFERVAGELMAGELKTSSATASHTADFYEDGAFRVWWLHELALTKNPAESRIPASILVRARQEGWRNAARQAGQLLFASAHNGPNLREDNLMENENQIATPEQAVAALLEQYSLEEIQAVLEQYQQPRADEAADEEEEAAPEGRSLDLAAVVAELERRKAASANKQEIAEMRSQLDSFRKQLNERQSAPPPADNDRRAPRAKPISVGEDLRYAHLTAEQMALGVKLAASAVPQMLQRRTKLADIIDSGVLSEEYVRSMAFKAAEAMAAAKPTRDPIAQVDRASLRSAVPFRSDELHATDITNHGAEWVEVFYDTTLWEMARERTELFNLMASRGMEVVTIPQGANGMNVKLNTASGTVYTLPEANDKDATNRPEVVAQMSQVTTSEVTENVATHVLAHGITFQLEEDSIINLVSWLPGEMQQTLAESIESTILNGDKTATASANINLIDDTPASGLATPAYIAWDGVRHQFLVENTAYSRDAAAALQITDFEATIKLLPTAIKQRRGQMLFVIDEGIESAARKLPELLTFGVAGERSTIYSGNLPPLFGVDLYMSGQLALSNTAGNNIKGQIALIYAPYWKYGRKRAITIEQDRFAMSQSTVFVATVRHAFKARGAGAAAGSYNVTV